MVSSLPWPAVWLYRVLSVVNNSPLAPTKDKYQWFRPRPWLIVIVGSLLIHLVRTSDGIDLISVLSRKGFPVQLTYSSEEASMYVTEGMRFLDVIKNCPSLYGDKARYISTWWLRS